MAAARDFMVIRVFQMLRKSQGMNDDGLMEMARYMTTAVREESATLTAQRDTARDIAARLEGECARAAEVCDAAWLWMLESGCDRRAPIMQRLRAIADGDPDAVIAEGES